MYIVYISTKVLSYFKKWENASKNTKAQKKSHRATTSDYYFSFVNCYFSSSVDSWLLNNNELRNALNLAGRTSNYFEPRFAHRNRTSNPYEPLPKELISNLFGQKWVESRPKSGKTVLRSSNPSKPRFVYSTMTYEPTRSLPKSRTSNPRTGFEPYFILRKNFFFGFFTSIFVVFVSGENPAAMQTGTSHRMQSTAPLFWVFLLLTCTQYLLHRAHFETASIVSRSSRLPNLFSGISQQRWIWGRGGIRLVVDRTELNRTGSAVRFGSAADQYLFRSRRKKAIYVWSYNKKAAIYDLFSRTTLMIRGS